MASIRKETLIGASPGEVWAALRDWGALHERLAPGFITDTRVDGSARIVSFFNGSVLREQILGVDDRARRLAWSIVDGPYSHHNGSAQVLAEPSGQTRFVWIADLLPDELAAHTAQLMERGLSVIKQTLESSPVRS